MNVNFTLFVQIFNFTITYFFLRRVFLKPFASIILQREKERTQAAYTIASKEAIIAQIHHEKQTRWEHFRNYCRLNVPCKELSYKNVEKTEIPEHIEPASEKEVVEKAGQLTFLIVKTLKNKVIQ